MMMGSKLYTKQCMYSLKQTHGAVDKKCCLHVFSKTREKIEMEKWFYVRGLQTWKMTNYFGICDTGMFSLTVKLCDDEDSG